jgi:PhoH-like ATPase
MAKIYVLDTNVLIHNPQAMFSFEENHVVIPITVIEEIDNFKKGLDEKGRNARQIGRYLDKLREQGSLQKGIPTEKNGCIQVVLSRHITETAEDILITDTNDNLIIGTALHIQKQNPDAEVVLISKDANVRIKADAVGLKAENYDTDRINFNELYTGYYNTTDEQLAAELKEKQFITNPFEHLYPNQFVRFCKQPDDEDACTIARFSRENNTLYPMKYYTGQELFGISARNDEQAICRAQKPRNSTHGCSRFMIIWSCYSLIRMRWITAITARFLARKLLRCTTIWILDSLNWNLSPTSAGAVCQTSTSS